MVVQTTKRKVRLSVTVNPELKVLAGTDSIIPMTVKVVRCSIEAMIVLFAVSTTQSSSIYLSAISSYQANFKSSLAMPSGISFDS